MDMDTPQAPSVDALFLEMLDLLNVTFPQIPREATISFLPTTDGSRACLSDMNCKAAPGIQERPDLGYDDDDLLASMNAVVGDLLAAIREQNNPIKNGGRIQIQSGDRDGEIEITVFEDVPDATPYLLQRRVFDFSELQMLIHTETLFAALNDSVEAEEEQSQWLDSLLETVASYEMDVETPKFVFMGEDGANPSVFHPALLATFVPTAHSFLWGWAQEQFPPAFLEKSIDLPKKKSTPGLRAFHQPELLCPNHMATRLVKHASVALGARGVYAIEKEGNAGPLILYIGLFDTPSPPPTGL
jgi:hypothetical protein